MTASKYDWAGKRILVTGGAGFIGSALVWELNNRGCTNIVIADYLGDSEKWRNLVPLRYEDYIEADDLLFGLSNNTLEKFDLILHMGACSDTTEQNAEYLIRNNYEYTKELAEYAINTKTRFVYASSAATYGDGDHGMSDSAPDLNVFRPLNMYGYSKHMFDLYASRKNWLNEIVGVKFFNIYGPNENHKGDMRSLVNKAYAQVIDSGVIKLFKSYKPEYADGEQVRDFLYVKDAVDMTLHLAANTESAGLYNIGSGEANTWVSLATAVFNALGRESNIEFIEMPEALRGKYQYRTQADISRLMSTGYNKPVTSLSDSVKDYVANYLLKDSRLGF